MIFWFTVDSHLRDLSKVAVLGVWQFAPFMGLLAFICVLFVISVLFCLIKLEVDDPFAKIKIKLVEAPCLFLLNFGKLYKALVWSSKILVNYLMFQRLGSDLFSFWISHQWHL